VTTLAHLSRPPRLLLPFSVLLSPGHARAPIHPYLTQLLQSSSSGSPTIAQRVLLQLSVRPHRPRWHQRSSLKKEICSFSQIFSRKIKANIDNKELSYEELRQHFLSLRKIYYSHSSDNVLRFGPFLASAENGGREGYIAAHMVMANLADDSEADHAAGMYRYSELP